MKKPLAKIEWDKNPNKLIPAIIQDAGANGVLMLGYMNKTSLKKTLATKRVWFFSRSKKRLWQKGEESKNYLDVVDIKIDCDGDAFLIKVKPAGPTCHTGRYSCFNETKNPDAIRELFAVIKKRKKEMPANSYTANLFSKGLNKICAKITEESTEVVRAAKQETKKRVIEETADLVYHLLVLLGDKKLSWEEVEKELERRK